MMLNFEIEKINNIKTNIEIYINKICEYIESKNFYEFIPIQSKLTNSIIEQCIKNKIDYFIINKISFSSIKNNFKFEFEKFLLECVKNICPYILSNIEFISLENLQNTNSDEFWDKIIDKLFSEPIIKNKVSFDPLTTEYTYKTEKSKGKIKKKPIKITILDNEIKNEISIEQKLSILLKILFKDKTYINSISLKLISMCEVLNNIDKKYDIYNPYN